MLRTGDVLVCATVISRKPATNPVNSRYSISGGRREGGRDAKAGGDGRKGFQTCTAVCQLGSTGQAAQN